MATTKKAIDTTRPGKIAPSSSSRPIIVGHEAVQDPMVKADAVADTPAISKVAPSAAKKVIKPLETTSPTTEQEATEPNQEQATEAAVVDAVAEQADLDKKKDQQDEADKKKQEEIEKLIVDKKYFVPIGQVAKRRNQRTSVAVLILLLLLVGGYLAVDANIIKLNVTLPIEVIKN